MSEDTMTEKHPSYGFIRMNRVCGGSGQLFMSPLRHDNRISIEIGPAEYQRSLSCDGHSSGRPVIRIEMSDEQFARFITSGGTHAGTPCTITRLNDQMIAPPPGEVKSEKWYEEMRRTAEKATAELAELRADLEAICAKVPRSVRHSLDVRLASVESKLADHMPWVVQAMHEGMDRIKNSAKIEFEAYANRRLAELQTAGSALDPAPPVLALEAHVDAKDAGSAP